MATYTYRCDVDGPVDVVRPIGTAPGAVACPTCGSSAARVITAPMLGLADRGRMSLVDRTERSRSEPDVVSSLPGAPRAGRRPAAVADPRTSRLPRP